MLLLCCLSLALAPGEPFLELSYDEALARSREQGRLLLVDATASWCGPCKKMEKDTWAAQSVRTWLSEHAVAIQIDVDEQRELSQSLKIEAMPTVIAFKDGAEFDRVVGYKGPDELLGWLGGVMEGKRAIEAVKAKAESAVGKDQVDARYDLARELSRNGDYDAALKEFMWLWRNTRDVPAYGGVRLSFMVSEIQRLCDVHEPAREAFLEILDATDVQVTQGGVTEYDVWAEWFALSEKLDGNRQVIAFYEQRRDEKGRLDLEIGNGFLDRYVPDQVFEVLLEKGRVADAARLVPDIEVKARQELAEARVDRQRDERMFAQNEEMLESMRDFHRRDLQTTLSRLHAAALAVDQADSALRIGQSLLDEYDDAESRVALVRLAIQVGRACPDHARWLSEAEASGADVAELRDKFDALPVVPLEPAAPADGR